MSERDYIERDEALLPPNPLAFVQSWLRDPFAVGLPFASSRWTARRLARATIDAAAPGGRPVLELGAGTGAVTQALIEEGCPLDRIVVVERDPHLCRYLQARFSGLHVIQGNALQFGEWKEIAGLGPLGAVVSGLPMRAIPHQAALRCYADAFRLMRDKGAIIQYTYGLRPPVDPSGAASLEAISLGREWRNFPPIGIWCYRRSM